MISVVVPLLNEAESLPALHEAIARALEGRRWEVIYCDDGSTDDSYAILERLAKEGSHVRVIGLSRRFGQTAAMAAGFAHVRGEVVVPIDADLQNDPADIPRLVAKLDEGFDVVSGHRRNRRDPFFTVTLPSKLANALIRRVTRVDIHDLGCTLSAYRREVLAGLHLHGDMHRFLKAYAAARGARVTELPVAHHPRRAGNSKYNLTKTFRVVRDLIAFRTEVARSAPVAKPYVIARSIHLQASTR